MKFRSSFITNSSSSSYTCELCKETYSGWDLSLTEAEMLECVNGHNICEHHFDETFIEKYLDGEFGEIDNEEDARYQLPEKFCPICNFTRLLGDDIVKYLIKYKNLDIESLRKEISENFDSYSDFIEKISK